MFRPTEIKTLPNYRLHLRFADGVEGEVDLSHLTGKGVFALWNDPAAFHHLEIGSSGEIRWSDNVDICSDALYLEITGKKVEEVFPNLEAEMHA